MVDGETFSGGQGGSLWWTERQSGGHGGSLWWTGSQSIVDREAVYGTDNSNCWVSSDPLTIIE